MSSKAFSPLEHKVSFMTGGELLVLVRLSRHYVALPARYLT